MPGAEASAARRAGPSPPTPEVRGSANGCPFSRQSASSVEFRMQRPTPWRVATSLQAARARGRTHVAVGSGKIALARAHPVTWRRQSRAPVGLAGKLLGRFISMSPVKSRCTSCILRSLVLAPEGSRVLGARSSANRSLTMHRWTTRLNLTALVAQVADFLHPECTRGGPRARKLRNAQLPQPVEEAGQSPATPAKLSTWQRPRGCVERT